MARPTIPAETRFWNYVDKSGECWLWTGASAGNGGTYGHLRVGREKRYAHRISYEMAMGPIPEGKVIDHKCHNRKCVNPAHLQAVTQKQNTENRGVTQPGSKTGIRGVSWYKSTRKWVVHVKHEGRGYNGGYFSDIKDAEAAAIALRNKLHTNNLKDRAA